MHGTGRVLAMVVLGLAAGAAQAQAPAVVPPPPDYAAGLRATLDQALAEGTNGALILFIARYPEAPLTEAARTALAGRTAPDPLPFPGPDGAIIDGFDRARLAGPAALAAFAAANPGHPLGAEARRAVWSR